MPTDGENRARLVEDASAFKDADVARAYNLRPPYPEALMACLAAAVAGPERNVIDLGCGTGDISRRLAPYVSHIDAVDFSAEMIAAGRAAPGGDAANIDWRQAAAEDFTYRGPYGLAVAGESIHWFDLPVVTRLLKASFHPEGLLALVGRGEEAPWTDAFKEIIPHHSMSVAYRPRDLIEELESQGLAVAVRTVPFGPEPFSQLVEDYIEQQHSRSSFTRRRLGPARAARFDDELRRILEPHAAGGRVTYQFSAPVTFLRLTVDG